MRETQFVEQNKQKWREFETLLDGAHPDPTQLNDLFIQITDDLAYARTFYANRSVRVYLNGLAQRAFNTLHRNKRNRRERFFDFWKRELPQLVYESRQAFRLSFFVFMLAVLIGIVSSAAVPEFLESILGQSYVEMTRENIDSGDPMAVYKQRGELNMALGITLNNILVALRTFVMGALFMIGSIFILLYNGIMLGSFEYFFFENGLLGESLLTVFMHGALEISAIVIAGAAGLTLGRGLVFPGTLTRIRAFQQSARRGVKIMAGTVPLFIMAGIIEGFITRHTEIPDVIRGVFIIGCLAFVAWYFVWLPVQLARRGFAEALPESGRLAPDRPVSVAANAIKSSGTLLIDAFQLFRLHLGGQVGRAALAAVASTAALFLLYPSPPGQAVVFAMDMGLGNVVGTLDQLLWPREMQWLAGIHALILGTLLLLATRPLVQFFFPEEPAAWKPTLWAWIHSLAAAALLVATLQLNGGLVLFVILFVAGFALLLVWAGRFYPLHESASWTRAWQLLFTQFGSWIGLTLPLLALSTAVFLLLDTSLALFLFQAILANFALAPATMQQLSTILLSFTVFFFLYLSLLLALYGAAVYYLSAREVRDANGLLEDVQSVGNQRRIKGLLRE